MDIAGFLFGDVSVRTHFVSYGENLATIALMYYGDPRCGMAIFQANRDRLTDPNRLYAGQQIVIPHLPHRARSHLSCVYV